MHMRKKRALEIRIIGLSDGAYDYTFDLDERFLPDYAPSDIETLAVQAKVRVLKSSSHMELEIELEGSVKLPCDRCLTYIDLPISSKYKVLLKYSDEDRDEGDIIYIPRGCASFDLSKSLYDFVSLSLPVIRTYDCEAETESPCDLNVLSRLSQNKIEKKANIWDSLKDQIKK